MADTRESQFRKLHFCHGLLGQPQAPAGGEPADTDADAQVEVETLELPAEPPDPTAPISLILDNADVYEVVRIIGDALNLNYVINPSVQGTVNISTSDTLRVQDLLPLLETVLKINGATMVQTGNFYQIVPANTAIREPLQVEDPGPQVASDDQFVVQVVRMRYVGAADMSGLLMPFLGDGGSIVVHESGNILLISDRRSNLRKLLDIVDVFDAGAFEGERVRVFPIENAFAGDLIPDLNSGFAGYALSNGFSAVRFVAIERLNSILVVTPNASVFPEVEKWLERLDQPLQSGGVQNFVCRVKNGKAVPLQRVLSDLYTATPGVGLGGGGAFNAPDAGLSGAGLQGLASTMAPNVDGVRPGLGIRIIADEITNSLVIQSTPQQYDQIEQTLRALDILPRQVLIDAQIYEVVLDESLAFGISASLQNRGTLTNPQTTASFPPVAAQTFAFVGRIRELVAFLNASDNRSRVRTLSAPSILVSDNMLARFEVGAEIPIPTSSSITPIQADGTNLFAQTTQFRTTGVILDVTPQITASGQVTLEISQEVSQASSNSTSEIVAPVIGKSSVASTIVVQDGQTIALGGFIRESNEVIRNRVPLLGRIPGLGALFGSTGTSTTRTELIILITPRVLTDPADADRATEEMKQKLREVQGMLQ